jgi:signal transduction histidine kinase
MLDAVRRSSDTGEAFLVLHRVTRDGDTRWVEGRGRAFLVEGAPVRMVGTCLDVTERQHYEQSLRETLAEVRASRARIVEAADAERQRVERDLHDGAQQRLLALSMALRLAEANVPSGDTTSELRSILEAASEELRAALAELRDLARGIHPALLTGQGLRPALESLVLRSPLPASVVACPASRFAEAAEVAVYYVVAESLTNALKHAAASAATVTVTAAEGVLRAEVTDDGQGGATVDAGTGLRGLADRVASLGGRLEILSPTRGGTSIVAEVPCA